MARVKFHTVNQPESDTTTFVLSCNRLDLLDRTLNSFLRTRDFITKMVIVDDSAEPGVFETLIERYGSFCDVICFPRNRTQWWAMDFMVSYCDSEYIFYLEDDWEFLQSGYLLKSKQILQRYRDIGTVDISWRTFEWQGIDSYDKQLIDNLFYYKKLWRITDYHLHWYGWIGSPNLKRRDDLILLGRIEKWHNEWNIDRKFLGLGFKAVFLNDKFVEHLGDDCSRAAAHRHNESTTPEDHYPTELQANRTFPKFNYHQWDTHWRHPNDITVVTAMLDISRLDRDFEAHYFNSVSNILQSRHPIVMFCEEKYFDKIRAVRGDGPLTLIPFGIEDLESEEYFQCIQNIIASDEWANQAEWMRTSVIRSPHYIPLTLHKHKLLKKALDYYDSSYYYWIDAGIYNSFHIDKPINDFYFTKIPKDHFFMTSFNYYNDKEIHGLSVEGIIRLCGQVPSYVCRASLFGGSKSQIDIVGELFYSLVGECVKNGWVGAEESLYTVLSIRHKELFNLVNMPTGDVYNNYIKTLK